MKYPIIREAIRSLRVWIVSLKMKSIKRKQDTHHKIRLVKDKECVMKSKEEYIQQDFKPALKEMGFNISQIPKSIYKYTGCDEKDKEEKIAALSQKKIWLCYAHGLNDPFEGLSLYVDKFELEKRGWAEKEIKALYEGLKSLGSKMLIGSFSESYLEEDMPLWAHYAYDHKGFCLEYEIIDDNAIYPVIYEDRRHLAAKTLSDFLIDSQELKYTEESMERFLVIWSSFMIKHQVWEYEKEYRILKYDYYKQSNQGIGRYFDEESLGLRLKSIYMGEKCTYKNELIEVGLKRSCSVYQMVLNPYQKEFKLSAEKIDKTLKK